MLTRLFVVLSLVLVFAMGSFAQEADTVFVPAETEDGDYLVNSLIDYVVADTNEAGEQLHKVYKLERGKLYLLDQAMDLRNEVELVADPPIADVPTMVPPKILSNTTADGETATHNLINTWEDITVKNIWLGGMSVNGSTRGWGYGQALQVMDSLVTVHLDGVWADYNGWSAFGTAQPKTSWIINNLHARNEQNPGDPWTTFLFFLEPAVNLDTFKVSNSTYFQSNSFFLFPPAYVNYFEVDHCTFANLLKWPFHSTQWLEAKVTNSVFYNVSALSLTENEEEGQDPDWLEYGLINVDTLFANAVDSVDPGPFHVPENERMIEVKNNLYYWCDGVQDYWANNDSVKAAVWMNDRTEAMFADDETWPGLIAENNWNQDPLFNDFDGLAGANKKMVDVCKAFRAGGLYQWDWDADTSDYPELYEVIYQYPLPEDFRSYSGLIGTDGLPLGDLSYYPETVGVEEKTQAPTEFALQQNYPNPFNPVTTINYQLFGKGKVQLTIYNVLGEKIRNLVDARQDAGSYSVNWNGANDAGQKVSSGVYFYSLETENASIMKKMTLIK
ncbi:MAG: T9SS type A sorting domain-containing protein [candidate division KSB1 bacterium]|nr:T9SS type A sorting domain-containing protein [candidate division KSB1 bacterium]